MRLLSEIDVSGKRVFVRADLDVPLGSDDHTQATRLTNLKPTIDYLLGHGAKQIIIAGHIDRPQSPDPALSTKNLINDLEKILSRSITFRLDLAVDDTGSLASMAQLVLFENLRFWPGEESNDPEFAKQLAALADVYVNEVFGNCHRNHASMVALPGLFLDVEDPEGFHPRRAAGLHLQREVKELSGVLERPRRPFVVVVGGAKIETKLPVIEGLAGIADCVLVGGYLPIEISKQGLNFPTNVVIATVAEDLKDISSQSIVLFKEKLASAGTVVLNGPMGKYEDGYGNGTKEVAKAIIESKAYSIVGGGNTEDFLQEAGLLDKFSFVSAGGGAMLEFLSGKKLPGIEAL